MLTQQGWARLAIEANDARSGIIKSARGALLVSVYFTQLVLPVILRFIATSVKSCNGSPPFPFKIVVYSAQAMRCKT